MFQNSNHILFITNFLINMDSIFSSALLLKIRKLQEKKVSKIIFLN